MKIQQNKTVGEIVREDYRAADIFKSHGIDFCCGGNKTLEQTCAKSDLTVEALTRELEQVLTAPSDQENDYDNWPLEKLVDHIVETHHQYVEENIPLLKGYLEKVVSVHGKQHPELMEVYKLFVQSAGELTQHMKKEELILFPFVKKMVKARQENTGIGQPHFGTVQNPIDMMVHEHDNEGSRFKQIAELTDNYQPPADACNTYRVTFHKLKEFEDDLHRHIHLENNILFPKAVALEKSLSA